MLNDKWYEEEEEGKEEEEPAGECGNERGFVRSKRKDLWRSLSLSPSPLRAETTAATLNQNGSPSHHHLLLLLRTPRCQRPKENLSKIIMGQEKRRKKCDGNRLSITFFRR